MKPKCGEQPRNAAGRISGLIATDGGPSGRRAASRWLEGENVGAPGQSRPRRPWATKPAKTSLTVGMDLFCLLLVLLMLVLVLSVVGQRGMVCAVARVCRGAMGWRLLLSLSPSLSHSPARQRGGDAHGAGVRGRQDLM